MSTLNLTEDEQHALLHLLDVIARPQSTSEMKLRNHYRSLRLGRVEACANRVASVRAKLRTKENDRARNRQA